MSMVDIAADTIFRSVHQETICVIDGHAGPAHHRTQGNRGHRLGIGLYSADERKVHDVKSLALSIPLIAAAVTVAPVAHAHMQYANYEVESPRDPGHSWLWAIRPCEPTHPEDCVHNQAIPRPNGQATPWDANGHLANGRYTMIVDVPDGVRCTVYFLPSHDTYTWDAVSLTGSVDSTYNAGCGGAPGGTSSWPFHLVRF